MPSPRLGDAKVYQAVAIAAGTITGLEEILWPHDGDPPVPEAGVSTAVHYLGITALSLEPLDRNPNGSADTYRLQLGCTLVTLMPEAESWATHADKVEAVCAALAEASFTDEAPATVRVTTDRATRAMVSREGLDGRGMATDITVTGMVQRT